jgi:hypothetical protein
MESYLVDCYDLTQLTFSKPKKYGEYLASRIKYKGSDDVLVQFPKMTITNINPKGVELEFGTNKYSKKVFSWLSAFDDLIPQVVETNATEWFGKELTKSQITQMYNKSVKAPKTLESQCCVGFSIPSGAVFVNSKNETIDVDELKQSKQLECISQLKFVVFSKDTCFLALELVTAKLDTRLKRVPQCAFIEDPNDCMTEPTEEPAEELSLCFF